MSTTTSWGIIGPGKIAKKFAAALGMVEGAALRAVASRDAARAAAFAKEYGAAISYSSYEDLVSEPGIDAQYMATSRGLRE